MSNETTDTPRTDACPHDKARIDDLAKDILKLHTPDPQVIREIATEQQATIKQMVFEIGTLRLELIAAQESEAVWKTERDKADQRRLEAEFEVERLRDEFLKSIVRDELQKKIIIKQHEILCQHGLSEYGN